MNLPASAGNPWNQKKSRGGRGTDHKTQTSPFRAPQGLGGGSRLWARVYLLTHGAMCGGISDAVAFEAQKNHLLASYNNQIGRPVGMYSGTIGGLLADGVLVPAAFVAVTEQL